MHRSSSLSALAASRPLPPITRTPPPLTTTATTTATTTTATANITTNTTADTTATAPATLEDSLVHHQEEALARISDQLDQWSHLLKKGVLAEFLQLAQANLAHLHKLTGSHRRSSHDLQKTLDDTTKALKETTASLVRRENLIERWVVKFRMGPGQSTLRTCLLRWRLKTAKAGSVRHSKRKLALAMASTHYQKAMMKKHLHAWLHDVMQKSWKKKIAAQAKVQVDSVRKEYTLQIEQMNAEIARLQQQLDIAAAERQHYAEEMKRALLRGVCALNVETMSMFNGQPPASIQPDQNEKENTRVNELIHDEAMQGGRFTPPPPLTSHPSPAYHPHIQPLSSSEPTIQGSLKQPYPGNLHVADADILPEPCMTTFRTSQTTTHPPRVKSPQALYPIPTTYRSYETDGDGLANGNGTVPHVVSGVYDSKRSEPVTDRQLYYRPSTHPSTGSTSTSGSGSVIKPSSPVKKKPAPAISARVIRPRVDTIPKSSETVTISGTESQRGRHRGVGGATMTSVADNKGRSRVKTMMK